MRTQNETVSQVETAVDQRNALAIFIICDELEQLDSSADFGRLFAVMTSSVRAIVNRSVELGPHDAFEVSLRRYARACVRAAEQGLVIPTAFA